MLEIFFEGLRIFVQLNEFITVPHGLQKSDKVGIVYYDSGGVVIGMKAKPFCFF